jgi:integrase
MRQRAHSGQHSTSACCAQKFENCSVYRGKLRNWGETRKALRPIHIRKELADDLWLWRQESKHPKPEDFIFPNRLRKDGFIDPQNYRRNMRKLVEELELPKLTFQAIRRTIATLAQEKGTPKDIPGRIKALAVRARY